MRKFFITIILLLAILLPLSTLRAEDGSQGRFKIGGNILFANGSQKMPFGYVDGLNSVGVSPGGGVGGAFLLGYGLHENLDLDFSAGYRTNESDEGSSRVDGTFGVAYTKLSLVPRIKVASGMFVKFNIGAGYYMGGIAKLETRETITVTDIKIKYKNALGYHLGTEFEYFISDDIAFNAGLTYNWVDYEYDEARKNVYNKDDGIIQAGKILLTDKRQSEPDGSGTEFILGMNYYF